MASRFRIFHRTIEVELSTIDSIVQTCCILHNFLSKNLTEPLNADDVHQISLPETMTSLPLQEHETIRFANGMRDNIKKYLVTDGDVSFQWLKIRKQVANEVSVSIE